MKILAVFLLTVLGCGLAEGEHVSKCELRHLLKMEMENPDMKAKMKVSNVDDVLAKSRYQLLILHDKH